MATQGNRYRRISTPGERRQTRWVVLGAAGAGTIAIGLTVPTLLEPFFRQPGALYQLASGPCYMLAVALLSAAVGMAALRSHLFDIDVIIRRALIYGLLTGALALIYAGSIVGAQAIIQAVGGQRRLPPVLIVASTLLIAALFQPLRRRIQGFIDRRFYRSKYDAARTVAAFGQALRSEVDLARLTEHLLVVVEETMQPTQAGLWLARPDRTAPMRPKSMSQGEANGRERVDAAG
ncbi:MAG TPA: hypothetical protein VGP82_16470 [Ktedonobacterales bacterium]|nr:hypothetical protein [Ktedonobacterales bacterium]